MWEWLVFLAQTPGGAPSLPWWAAYGLGGVLFLMIAQGWLIEPSSRSKDMRERAERAERKLENLDSLLVERVLPLLERIPTAQESMVGALKELTAESRGLMGDVRVFMARQPPRGEGL